VFDGVTGAALNLYRTKRTASPAQRIMLIARDGGCTKPCCPVGAYGSQVHHAVADWANDGNTNVDDMTLACPPDNRMVGPGGYTTSINDRHEVEWAPPQQLDNGQTRINYYHRPELLLCPPDDDATREVVTTNIEPNAGEPTLIVRDAECPSDTEPFDPGLPDRNDQADGGKGVRGP
jgi:hypothetical protein